MTENGRRCSGGPSIGQPGQSSPVGNGPSSSNSSIWTSTTQPLSRQLRASTDLY